MTFKYIELFAGIGGFRSALDGLGGGCVFASEIDKYASQAYKALYNGAQELHGDITKIDAHNIPDHDVLVGGFPCQAFSVAGQRKGFEDARGTLFFEIARIASAKQPRLMLLENVKGLLSHDGGKTFETMCVILHDIGYAIDFRVLNSKHFGVPQNRERIFLACDRNAEHAEWDVTGSDVVARAKRRVRALGIRTFNFDWPENGEVTTRLRDVLEMQVDEKYYLSEEKTAKLIAQLEERGIETNVDGDGCAMVGRVNISGYDQRKRVYSPDGLCPTPSGLGASGNEPKIVETTVIAGSLEHYGNDQMNRVYSVDGLAPTITVVSGGGREQKIAEPYTVFQKTTSWTTTVKYDETGTLQAARLDKVPQVVTPRYRIRKLTPRECWRLQGFTDAQHDAVMNAGISDSQRYKQAGNAVTVNVIRAVGKPLVKRLKQTESSETGNRSTSEMEAV
ncbi:DNA (cytosine-5-)-methyltransferase [Paenibacillus sp. JNUCC32]|uniref:DNA (cytosine-5-)-methyltransferase n=1 Tax=Paenibacillus sp. JNUCC32 TaxID=2777984 RepID=UPI001E5D471B|nr:DNA (cytosine-5-)-methyltransferase [Paenibacillus sp. JNUCC-32]